MFRGAILIFLLLPIVSFGADSPNQQLLKARNEYSVKRAIDNGADNLDEALSANLNKDKPDYYAIYTLFDYGAKISQKDADKIKLKLANQACLGSGSDKVLELLIQRGYGHPHMDWGSLIIWSKDKSRLNCALDMDEKAGILDEARIASIIEKAQKENNNILVQLATERLEKRDIKKAENNSVRTINMKCDVADATAVFEKDKLYLDIAGAKFQLNETFDNLWRGDKITMEKRSNDKYQISFEKGEHFKTYNVYDCEVK